MRSRVEAGILLMRSSRHPQDVWRLGYRMLTAGEPRVQRARPAVFGGLNVDERDRLRAVVDVLIELGST
jgi:hypothetical protein